MIAKGEKKQDRLFRIASFLMGGVVTGDTCYPTTSVGAYRDSTQAFTIPPEGKLKL